MPAIFPSLATSRTFLTLGVLSSLALSACFRSEIVLKQDKPMDINVNLTGRLELVITDARKDVEAITGSKRKRTLTPADIGLPVADTTPSGSSRAPETASVVLLANMTFAPRPTLVQTEDQIKQSMAGRSAQIMQLLDAQLVGESHTGQLSVRGALNAQQQALVATENADRQKLYAAEAKRRNIGVDQVALAYYMARLEHINKGAWYEKYNQATKQWAWVQMQ